MTALLRIFVIILWLGQVFDQRYNTRNITDLQKWIFIMVNGYLKCICANIVYVKMARTILFVLQVNDSWEMQGVDLIGPYTETKWGNKFIFTATNYFTKWVEGFIHPDKMAAMVAKCICHFFFIRASHAILTDQWWEFVNHVCFKTIKKSLDGGLREHVMMHIWGDQLTREHFSYASFLRISKQSTYLICWSWTHHFGILPLSNGFHGESDIQEVMEG